ncbi:MAG: tRNA wybutosine-synthesizing 3 family protein [Candidatus Woesearchaeota archaeon]
MFDEQKQRYMQALLHPDKSRAGSCDIQIKPLLDILNAHPDVYTTSSCAGRIMVLQKTPQSKKHETTWLLVSHEPIIPEQVYTLPLHKDDIWFKMEAPIIHLCVRDLHIAQYILSIAHQCGIKHSGILHIQPRIIIELLGRHAIETPLCINGKQEVHNNYIIQLVEQANKKLKDARAPFTRFGTLFSHNNNK